MPATALQPLAERAARRPGLAVDAAGLAGSAQAGKLGAWARAGLCLEVLVAEASGTGGPETVRHSTEPWCTAWWARSAGLGCDVCLLNA